MFIISFVNGFTEEITEEQSREVFTAMKSGNKHIVLPKGIYMTASIASVMEKKKYEEQRAKALSERSRFQCKFGRVHKDEDGCDCKPLANERPKEGQLLLDIAESPGVSKETLAKTKVIVEKIVQRVDATPKKKESEWNHDSFLRTHPGLHEFSEAVNHAYDVTGL